MATEDNIQVGVFPLEKDAQTCFERQTCKNPGAEVEIFKMIFRLIGVNYTVIDVWKEFGEQYDFGAKQPNGSWSGMIGLLQEGKLDMIGLSMRMSSEREEAVLFSYPTRVFESVFVIAPPSFTCTRQFIFNAFSRTVWLFIVCSVLLLYFTTLLINFVKIKYFIQYKPISRFFIELLSTSIGLFSISSKVLLLVILFATFILSQLYQTDMYAFLSAPLTYDIPFRSIKQALDLVEQKKMYFAAFDTQNLLCTPNTCGRFQQVVKKNPIRRADTEKDVQNLIL
uniref:Lig_chan-Glu_bd domain-containing protein n=1 Tax=Caenorhabditis japonica TaxID=281687 RepID=A0A8R1I4G5_CAEJA